MHTHSIARNRPNGTEINEKLLQNQNDRRESATKTEIERKGAGIMTEALRNGLNNTILCNIN